MRIRTAHRPHPWVRYAVAVAVVTVARRHSWEVQAQPCVPRSPITCAYACGPVDDNCGGILECGGCGTGETCVNGACQCLPSTCESEGFDCGEFMSSEISGCGELLGCGTCNSSSVCVDNVCRCIPRSCASLGATCGTWDDGCGGTFTCGLCHANQTCDVDSYSCQCKKATCEGEGATCGTLSDNCGGSISCGVCTGFQEECNADYACECVSTTCSIQGKNCGRISDGCPGPGSLGCGTCEPNEFCNDTKICECVPKTCQSTGATCGRISDGCGYAHQNLDQELRWLRPMDIENCGGCATTAVCNGTLAAAADPCEETLGMMTCRNFAGCVPRASCFSYYDVPFLESDIPVFEGPTQCLTCPDGTRPNVDQTQCIKCAAGSYRNDSSGFAVLTPGFAGVGGQCTACTMVSQRHIPNADNTECVCVPRSCAEASATCGVIDNLCGETISCGSCGNNTWGDPDECANNNCQCVPTTCLAAPAGTECGRSTGRVAAECTVYGATCGAIPNGCGQQLNCGSCEVNSTYVSACTEFKCECIPTTCEEAGTNCGTIPDRCGGTIDCGQCRSNACEMILYADNMPDHAHTPETHIVVPGDEVPLSPSELNILIGDSVQVTWEGQHQWDHLHVGGYLSNPDAVCPETLGILLDSDDPYFFGTYTTDQIDTDTSSEYVRYLRARGPCAITQNGGIECSHTQTFESIPLVSLPKQAPTVYNWPSPMNSSFVPHIAPQQLKTGTYCIGTSTSRTVKLVVHVRTPICDHTLIGRGSPCDLVPPTCIPDVPYVLLLPLWPLNPIFANATCPELKLLLEYLGVGCSQDISGPVPAIVQQGGDGTLQSLCPVTCGLCPRETVDDTDYGSDPATCSAQNGTCHVQWESPLTGNVTCKTRRLTHFIPGNLTCGSDTVNNTCACSPTTCLHEGFDCGFVPDGCNSTLACGVCEENSTACYDNVCSAYRPEPEPEPEPEPIEVYCEKTGKFYEWFEYKIPCEAGEPGCLYRRRGPTWTEARDEAVRQGQLRSAKFDSNVSMRGYGYLATVSSGEEQECIAGLSDEPAWLGASDNASEGEWQWIEGPDGPTEFSYSNWGRYDPSPVEGNNFLTVNYALYTTGQWRAEPHQSGIHAFVLEYQPIYPIPEPEPEPEPNELCPPGSMPNAQRTACVGCKNITESFCLEDLYPTQPLHAGQTNASREPFCVDSVCIDGACVSPTGMLCERCTEGMSSNRENSECATCIGTISVAGEPCHRCYPGSQPNWLAGGVECLNCSAMNPAFASSGDVCLACNTGQQPRADRGVCLECSLYEYSTNGTVCIKCPDGQLPTSNGQGCEFMHVQLTLDADISGWTLPEQNEFTQQFMADVANMVSIGTDRIRVFSLYAGSLVVGFEFTPSGTVQGGELQPIGLQPEDLLIGFQSALTQQSTLGGFEVMDPFFENVMVLVGNVNECVTDRPCLNGSCIQRIGNYSCACYPGFLGRHCQVDINECESNPCQNGATCTEGVDLYSCRCVSGWTGHQCETDIDECSSNPCQNGATCRDSYQFGTSAEFLDFYNCSCLAGFRGGDCEVNIDECASAPCVNGATCHEFIDRYTCNCAAGWTGSRCRIDIDECTSLPCQNSGTCADSTTNTTILLDEFLCTCVTGYGNDRCEIDVDECLSGACLNDAVCSDSRGDPECGVLGMVSAHHAWWMSFSSTNGRATCIPRPGCDNICTRHASIGLDTYRCFCSNGWGGEHCDEDFDECVSNPCQNGGSCSESIVDTAIPHGEYRCACAEGYEGWDCEINIDECASNPCRNQTLFDNCLDKVASYYCACAPGFAGPNCLQDYDECASVPCQHGGTCSHRFGTNDYTCACVTGYTDDSCQININDCLSRPCLNGASCSDRVDAYQCTCVLGWEGPECQGDVDECIGHYYPYQGRRPCYNGATCFESTIDDTIPISEYHCSCMYGFTGIDCEIDLDECASEPCVQGATCSDGPGDYVCTCSPGYGGKECKMEVDTYDDCLQNDSCRQELGWFQITIFGSVVVIPFASIFVALRMRQRAKAIAPFTAIKEISERRQEVRNSHLRQLEARVRRALAKLSQVQLAITFKEQDVDISGDLDAKELHAILNGLGVEVSAKESLQLLHAMDEDGEKGLTYEEFLSYFTKAVEITEEEAQAAKEAAAAEAEAEAGAEDRDAQAKALDYGGGPGLGLALTREDAVGDATLTVTIHCLTDLIAANREHMCSSPWVQVYCGSSHPLFSTDVQNRTLNPTYAQSFEFAIKRSESHSLSVTIGVRDGNLDNDQNFLGGMCVSLYDQFQTVNGWGAFVLKRRWPLASKIKQPEFAEVNEELIETHLQSQPPSLTPFGVVELELAVELPSEDAEDGRRQFTLQELEELPEPTEMVKIERAQVDALQVRAC